MIDPDHNDLKYAREQPHLNDASTLVRFAASVLPSLRLPSGTYCFDREWTSRTVRGDSLRYTLMVALGSIRAISNGYGVHDDVASLIDGVLARESELTAGDRGLALWSLVRRDDDRAAQLIPDLQQRVDTGLADLPGMEPAWIVIGAAEAARAGVAGADRLVTTALGLLDERQSDRSPLFRHTSGRPRGRSMLPNFATQIYSVLALASVIPLDIDRSAATRATELADLLIERRDTHGGWPWLFHASDGAVVERYEVYSVHQDAMAPMALFALADAIGDNSYVAAAVDGLSWCFGRNELGFNFYDPANSFAHRSIKRSGWRHRAGLGANTALALVGTNRRVDPHGLAVNTTCRPYHLGWMMEAWAGREAHLHGGKGN